MNPEIQTRGDLSRPDLAGPVPVTPAMRVVAAVRPVQAGSPSMATLTPLGLLRALRRRLTLAAAAAVLLAGFAGPAAWYLVPPAPYKAQARLHVATHIPKVIFQTVDAQNGTDYNRYQSTQQTLVKSRMVLAAAIRDPKVARYQILREAEDPVEWLQQKLQVGFIAGSEVMEISLVGSDPEEVAGLVNAVKKAYMDEVVNFDLKQRIKRYDQLKEIRDDYTELLAKKRKVMRELAESVGSDDRETLALRQQYALEHLHYLQTQLRDVQSRKRQFEVQLRVSRSGQEMDPSISTPAGPEPLTEAEIVRLVDQDPLVVDLASQLAEARRRYEREWATVRKLSRTPHAEPSIRHLRDGVKSLEMSLARRRREARPEVVRQARHQDAIEAGERGQDDGRELAMLAELERQLNAEIKSINLANHSLASNTLDLQSQQDEMAQMDLAAKSVAHEVEALNVELQAPPRIRPIDEATVPRTRDEKKRYMMVAMATLGSFFGGLFGIAFLELQARKVDTADEVPTELGLAVVGGLPILPARAYPRGALSGRGAEKERHWRNLLLESVDATRTLLVHAARTGSYRVMLITSAMPGEGKTSLASYLATSLARSGLRTLVIDADLRSPMMHKILDRPVSPGLAELLRGEFELDDAVAATAVEGLWLLPAGRCDRQALRALAQGGIAPLFDQLKEQFDFILVDTSPILPVADAMLIAQYADAAIFSIFRDVSRKNKVRAACERLQRLGVPVLGAVVTGAHGGVYGSDYYGPDSSYGTLPDSVAPSHEQVG